MGSAHGYPDEYPTSRVKISKPFYIGKLEVANSQYSLFDAAHRSGYISHYNKDQNKRGEIVNRETQPVIRIALPGRYEYGNELRRP